MSVLGLGLPGQVESNHGPIQAQEPRRPAWLAMSALMTSTGFCAKAMRKVLRRLCSCSLTSMLPSAWSACSSRRGAITKSDHKRTDYASR